MTQPDVKTQRSKKLKVFIPRTEQSVEEEITDIQTEPKEVKDISPQKKHQIIKQTESLPSLDVLPKYLFNWAKHTLTQTPSTHSTLAFKDDNKNQILASCIGTLNPSLKTVSVWANSEPKRDPTDSSEQYNRGIVFYLESDKIGKKYKQIQ